ncbi:bifunctional nicotinamidase/pyrazinamidase [Verrucomicrobiaceae bacterium 227]
MKALLVIDLQNDFLPGGSLGVPGGDQIIPLVNELMPEYPLVVATQDWHPENHTSFASNHSGKNIGDTIELDGLQQILWPTHCIEGSKGAKFADSLDTRRFDHIIRKGSDPQIDSYSGFFDNGHRKSTGLTKLLKEKGVTEVHLCGLATDYCVKFTALDALKEGFKVTLIKDACRGVNLNPDDVHHALSLLESEGVKIRTSEDILGKTITLYRPTGPHELAKLEANNFTAWPPRLPDQPIFYPVMNQAYAAQIATEWNIRDTGSGYVTRFKVDRHFLKSYPRKVVGGSQHEELWIPSEDLDQLNKHLVGKIEVIQHFEPNEKV